MPRAAPLMRALRRQEAGGSVFGPGRVDQFSSSDSRRKRVALVVLLRGINVGGHRTFRPTKLAEQLKHLDAVNIGAAGTFVIRRPVTRAQRTCSRGLSLLCQIGQAIDFRLLSG